MRTWDNCGAAASQLLHAGQRRRVKHRLDELRSIARCVRFDGAWTPNRPLNNALARHRRADCWRQPTRFDAAVLPNLPLEATDMDAALYFELVDAIAKVDRESELAAISSRLIVTAMHPLERRVLERGLRARGEAIALQSQFVMSGILVSGSPEAKPLAAKG